MVSIKKILIALILATIVEAPAFCALTKAVLEIRTTGSDTNGGGWSFGGAGADMSQFDNKNATGCTSCFSSTADLSDVVAVTAGTTTVTCASCNFSTNLPGNIIYLQGGTGAVAANWYQVATRASATSITVDRSTGLTAGTGVTINIGGALASLGIASSILNVNGGFAFMKNGTYSITSVSSGVSGGVMVGGSNAQSYIGYSTHRSFGNTDTQPIVQVNVSTVGFLTSGSNFNNITFDGNNQTQSSIGSGIFIYCTLKNFNRVVDTIGNHVQLIGSILTGNSATLPVTLFAFSEAFANTATPVNPEVCINSLSYSNTGASTDGYGQANVGAGTSGSLFGCIGVLNGRDGYRQANSNGALYAQNSVMESNTGIGWNYGTTGFLVSSTYFGNGTNLSSPGTYLPQLNLIASSGTVFVSSTNFALNNLASQGAALRAAGVAAITSNLFPRGLTQTFLDIGPAQHQGSTASGAAQ